ncbi:MAG: extracellular solute-binding protein [Clostridiales bacterium]|nr:extracellular solute-binding protein [Clostridiales bacterium]
MIRLKVISGLVSIFLILSLLFGCTSGSEETEEPVTKLYFMYPRDGSQIFKRLIYEYNQMYELDQSEAEESQGQNQILIEGIEVSGTPSDFFQQFNMMSEEGETVPDVMLIHDTWLAKMAEEECILPLDGGLNQNIKNDFFKGLHEAMIWNGRTYGIPFRQDQPLLYYRSDLVGDDLPSSWIDLAYTAKRIISENDIDYGLVFPGDITESTAAFLSSIWSFFGAEPDFETGDIQFDEAGMKSAWSLIKRMISDGTLSSDVLDMSPEECRAVMEAGNAAFMWNWSYATRILLDEDSPLYGKIAVTTLPVSEENGGGGIISGYALVINKATGFVSEAWNFIKFLISRENQEQLFDAGWIPANKSLYQSYSFLNLGLPSDFPAIFETGRTINPGTNVEGVLSMMNQAAGLALLEDKSVEELSFFIKEGMVVEEIGPGAEESE